MRKWLVWLSGAVITLAVPAWVALTWAPSGTKRYTCVPTPNGIATCVRGRPVSWGDRVIEKGGQYYAPADELAATLGARLAISADKKHVTINGKELSTSGGVTNTLEQDGKVYIIILDAANAAGYSVAIDFINRRISIVE